MVGITDVDLGKENPTAFLHNEIIEAISGRVREIHNEPPLAGLLQLLLNLPISRVGRGGKGRGLATLPSWTRKVLIHYQDILEVGLHVLGSRLEQSNE